MFNWNTISLIIFIILLIGVFVGLDLTDEEASLPFLLICSIERAEIIHIISTSFGNDYLVRTDSGDEILCFDVTECKGSVGDTTWLLRTKWYSTIMDDLPKWRHGHE